MFVFNVCIFGGVSGAGIFGTQFYGKSDYEGQPQPGRYRHALRQSIHDGSWGAYGAAVIRKFMMKYTGALKYINFILLKGGKKI